MYRVSWCKGGGAKAPQNFKKLLIICILFTVWTQFVTTPNGYWVCTSKAQIIKFVKRGFERLGLGHRAAVGVASVTEPRPRSLWSFVLLLSCSFGTPWFGRQFVPPSLNRFSFLFIIAFTLPPPSTCKLNFLGLRLVQSAHT